MRKLSVILQNTQYANHSIKRFIKDNYECPNIFILTSPEGKRFYLKIRATSDYPLKVSLPLMEKINDSNNLFQKYSNVLCFEGKYFLVTEKVIPKIKTQKDMSELFRRLAIFHKENKISDGPVTSNYLDYMEISSIPNLIDKEFQMHQEHILTPLMIPKLKKMLEPLKMGFKTVIHGNIHSGNMIFQESPILIDTETVHISCNLYDFEYFDSYSLYGESPWYIQKDAQACYDSYFGEMNYSVSDRNITILAIELLNLLRENTFKKYNGDDAAYEWTETLLKKLIDAYDG